MLSNCCRDRIGKFLTFNDCVFYLIKFTCLVLHYIYAVCEFISDKWRRIMYFLSRTPWPSSGSPTAPSSSRPLQMKPYHIGTTTTAPPSSYDKVETSERPRRRRSFTPDSENMQPVTSIASATQIRASAYHQQHYPAPSVITSSSRSSSISRPPAPFTDHRSGLPVGNIP